MTENKKVKNASAMTYDGIAFKSALEVMTYKVLREEGFDAAYEKEHLMVWEGFAPTIPLFTKNTLKRKDCRYDIISLSTMVSHLPQRGIIYTPDFTFEYNGRKIFVEVKGFQTEAYKHRFKIFRKYLEEQPEKERYIIWEIHTKKQLLECINFLRTLPSL